MTEEHLNLDSSEKDRFEEIAAYWWDPEGPMKPLHDMNPARLQFIAERCTLKDRQVLDLGCGGGILAESMSAKGARVTGIDIAEKLIRVAQLHQVESGHDVNYEVITAEQKAAKDQEIFDVVTCMEMLEHVPEPAAVVQAAADLLRPGGDAFFSTLNRTLHAFLLAIAGAEYIARICPRGTHRYDRFIRPSELGNWLRRSGLHLKEIVGIHYEPVSRSVMLGGHTRMNYLVHARKPDRAAGA